MPIYPTEKAYPATSGFGGKRRHDGIDYGVPTGTRLLAPESGRVRYAGIDGSRALYIDILGVDGVTYRMVHLKSFTVKTGQMVKQGDLVGYSDNTGIYTTGPHLHAGTLRNNVAFNPATLSWHYINSQPQATMIPLNRDLYYIVKCVQITNVRKDATTISEKTDTLPIGTEVLITGYKLGQVVSGNNLWASVAYGNKTGWIWSSNLKVK